MFLLMKIKHQKIGSFLNQSFGVLYIILQINIEISNEANL